MEFKFRIMKFILVKIDFHLSVCFKNKFVIKFIQNHFKIYNSFGGVKSDGYFKVLTIELFK